MSFQNVTLAELNEQQSTLYRWEYFQYGVVSFWITDADFDSVDEVKDIRYLTGDI
jgi:bifunctional pyridoxal-dependent enzyme with beta-cystathionase and maltose regulon repressor activities